MYGLFPYQNYFQDDDAKNRNEFAAKAQIMYRLIDKAITFDKSMRQSDPDQEEFKRVLGNLSDGNLTLDDWKVLHKRAFTELSKEEQEFFENNATMLCATNKALKKFNIQKLKKLPTPKFVIKADNINWQSRKASSNTAGSLQNVTLLAKGCRAMLTKNLWKEAGLVNGAQGTIEEIVYKPGNDPSKGPPDIIYMNIPQYIGPPLCPETFPDNPKVVPIIRQKANWIDGKVFCTRTQFPLLPSYAITIHKSQGMTLELVILDVGDREFAVGLSYTGLSRVKRLQNIAFLPMPDFVRLSRFAKTPIFKKRLDEDLRLKDLEEATLAEYLLQHEEFFDAVENID